MSFKTIIYEREEHVAYLTLNRPEANNAVSGQMARELAEICQAINQDTGIYVTMVTGNGRCFSTGSESGIRQEEYAGAADSLAGLGQPVIVALNGDAIGQGLELALAGDIRLAAEGARFGLDQVARGQIPGGGGSQRLPRLVGRGKAMELILTGELISAQEALEIGLVSRVLPADRLVAEAKTQAQNFAVKAPVALKFLKEAVNQGLDLTLGQGLRLEADLYFLLHTTADRTEGIKAFLEKRPPKFEGR